MQEFEATGNTVDEAIKIFLEENNLKHEDIEVTIIDSGSKGILGFNKRLAKVLIRKNFDLIAYTEKLFQKIISSIDLKVDAIIKLDNKDLNIELVGEDARFFIGKHGCILDAFSQILNSALKKFNNVKVIIDAENYRLKQREMLEHLAITSAKKVERSHVKCILKPMSSYERLIVHKTLQSFPNIITYSEGENQNRHIVIDWQDSKKQTV